ncbi:MAG: glycosyltransferase [Chlamydiales bacterium]
MASKKILMACSNPWTSVFQVGSHHLAREFVKLGYEIAYLSDPISPLHFLGGAEELQSRFEIYRSGGLKEGRLWAYVPLTLLPPHPISWLRSEWVFRHWHRFTFPSALKRVGQNGFHEVDILYLDTAVQSFWIDEIKARKTIFRIADQNAGFKKSTPALLNLEKELIKKVDLVVCTAKTLVDSVRSQGVCPVHLPNGVPLAHFAKSAPMPAELKNISKPIAIYVGAIDYWFDDQTLKSLAEQMPHISFVLIGPAKQNRFEQYKNIHLLGPRPYSEIPQYLQHADVGLIPFNVRKYPDLIHNVNPLKLYEYMASGLPTVATRWQELENIGSPAHLCSSVEEFRSAISDALRSPNPSMCRDYAATLDWSSRARQLIEWLGCA